MSVCIARNALCSIVWCELGPSVGTSQVGLTTGPDHALERATSVSDCIVRMGIPDYMLLLGSPSVKLEPSPHRMHTLTHCAPPTIGGPSSGEPDPWPPMNALRPGANSGRLLRRSLTDAGPTRCSRGKLTGGAREMEGVRRRPCYDRLPLRTACGYPRLYATAFCLGRQTGAQSHHGTLYSLRAPGTRFLRSVWQDA
jgi:hypothetical protein